MRPHLSQQSQAHQSSPSRLCFRNDSGKKGFSLPLRHGVVQICNYSDNSGHQKPFSQGNKSLKVCLCRQIKVRAPSAFSLLYTHIHTLFNRHVRTGWHKAKNPNDKQYWAFPRVTMHAIIIFYSTLYETASDEDWGVNSIQSTEPIINCSILFFEQYIWWGQKNSFCSFHCRSISWGQ